jgi:hypothetical protein
MRQDLGRRTNIRDVRPHGITVGLTSVSTSGRDVFWACWIEAVDVNQ